MGNISDDLIVRIKVQFLSILHVPGNSVGGSLVYGPQQLGVQPPFSRVQTSAPLGGHFIGQPEPVPISFMRINCLNPKSFLLFFRFFLLAIRPLSITEHFSMEIFPMTTHFVFSKNRGMVCNNRYSS
jgi:hypothetical protein